VLKISISSGDAFNRDMQLDLSTEYHVTKFRIDCRLADAFDNVDVAVTLLVCEGNFGNKQTALPVLRNFFRVSAVYLQ